MSKPTSFEIALTERYTERLDKANMSRHAAKLALKRIAQIYSGQLSFTYPERELSGRTTEVSQPPDTLDTPFGAA